MRFEKTNGDLRTLGSQSGSGIGWNEVLSLMLDITLDVQNESESRLDSLELTGDALIKWNAVVRAVLKTPLDSMLNDMPDHTRERVSGLRQKLEEQYRISAQAEEQFSVLSQTEEELKFEIKENEKKRAGLESKNKDIARLRQRIEEIERQTDLLGNIDTETLQKTIARLETEKAEKERLSADFARYSAELDDLSKKNSELGKNVAGVRTALENAENENKKLGEQHEHSSTELKKAQTELEEQRRLIDRAADSANTQIAELNSAIEKARRKEQQMRCELTDKESEQADLNRQNEELTQLLEKSRQKSSQLLDTAVKTQELINDEDESQKRSEERIKTLEAELKTKKLQNEQYAKDIRQLGLDISELDGKINEIKGETDALNSEIVEKNILLNEQKEKLADAKGSLDNNADQLRIAQETKSEIEAETLRLKTEIEDVAKQIATMKFNGPKLHEELDLRKSEYAKRVADKDAETQKITQEIDALNLLLEQTEGKLGELNGQKSSVESTLGETNREIEKISDEKKLLEQEADRLRIQLNNFRNEKNGLLEEKKRYIEEIKTYENFLGSEECKKNHREIERLRQIANEYQEGINALFNRNPDAPVYAGLLEELDESYRGKKEKLGMEMENLRSAVRRLSTDYLDIVTQIEERVNL